MDESFPFQLLTTERVSSHPKGMPIMHRSYNLCTIEYVTDGAGFLEIAGKRFVLEKDSVYFLYKGSTHRYGQIPENPWSKIYFIVDGELMSTLLRIYRLDKVYFIPDAPELYQYFDALHHLKLSDPRCHQQAAVIFHEFAEACANHLYKEIDNAPATIKKLKNALEHSVEKEFTLADYCRRENITTAYAVRAFHSSYGMPPGEYLLNLRLETAQRMLRYGNFSIKEIAAKLNFSDQYHFSNFYKKRTGESPLHYQKKWH